MDLKTRQVIPNCWDLLGVLFLKALHTRNDAVCSPILLTVNFKTIVNPHGLAMVQQIDELPCSLMRLSSAMQVGVSVPLQLHYQRA